MQNSVRKYLSEIGKKGGLASSEAKARAVRENGKLGGRPKMLSETPDSFGILEPLEEMANLDPKLHHLGVNANIHVWSPNPKPPHGTRVKVFKQSIEDGFTVPVLDDLEKMKSKVKGDTSILSQSDVSKIIKNIHKAREVFREYWNNPNMTVSEISKKIKKAVE